VWSAVLEWDHKLLGLLHVASVRRITNRLLYQLSYVGLWLGQFSLPNRWAVAAVHATWASTPPANPCTALNEIVPLWLR